MENLEKNLETVKKFVMETLINLYYFFKGVYPYEYIDSWSKFNLKSLPRNKKLRLKFEKRFYFRLRTCEKSMEIF